MKARLWYVNVFASDFERAVEFYRDRLGLSLQFSDPAFGYASFAAGNVGLAVVRVDPDAEGASQLVGRHTGIALGVPDLEAAYQELRSRGVEFTLSPTRQAWGGVLAIFADSEGNLLYLDQLRDE